MFFMNQKSFAKSILPFVILMTFFFLFSSFKPIASKEKNITASPQWKRCWGEGKWWHFCAEIHLSFSIHNTIEITSSLVDKIDVNMNEDESALVFTFPPELKGCKVTIVSRVATKTKPGSKNKRITIYPNSYTVPESLKITSYDHKVMNTH